MNTDEAVLKQVKPKGLSSTTLKTIAIVAMVIDHIAYAFVPYDSVLSVVMHFIGRTTGPIMFYSAVEGYHHTKNINRYTLRLAVFAVISYFPFLFFSAGGDLLGMHYLSFNVIFTILMGVLAIRARREIKNPVAKIGLILLLICLCVPADWGVTGIIIIISFDFYYGNFKNQAYAYLLIVLLHVGVLQLVTGPIVDFLFMGGLDGNWEYYIYSLGNAGMLIPLLLLKYYNGQVGPRGRWSKWFFYIFYPAHLLVIGLIQFFARMAVTG